MKRPAAELRRIAERRRAVAGFVGSQMLGHRDVPELGWWRPTTAECRGAIIAEYAEAARKAERSR